MNCIFRSFIAVSAIALASLPAVCFPSSDQRTALVIGNSTYENAPLKNPANDATDMAIMLKQLGFEVTIKTNATRRTMQNAINAFGKKLNRGGVGLFYYAGHGLQVKGHNYLIPVNAQIESESDVDYEAVDAGRVLGKMEDADNGFNIIILDACRNNPLVRSFRSGTSGLAKMDAPSGSILAFSTAPGSVAADGTGRNGLYTSKLLKHMAKPDLRIEAVFKQVRIDVARDSGMKQTPWESSSLMGDFYFNPDRTKSTQPARAISVERRQGPQALNAEEETWAIVKTSSIVEDYLLFLDRYPDSRFSTAAMLKIGQLKRKQNAKPASLSSTGEKEIASDGTFLAYANGVVFDMSTNLEWIAGPDRETTWNDAKEWAQSLNVAGGGWRMPTRDELKMLFKKGAGTRNITPLLKTTGRWVWSGETKESSSAWDFQYGSGYMPAGRHPDYDSRRGFAVRSKGL